MPRTSQHQGAQQRKGEPGNAGPIDHAVLDKLLCEDRDAVGVVLRQFRSSCPGDASALGVALSRNDNKDALRWAHRLKGACQMVGATRLAEICERAEVAVRAGDAGTAAQAVSDIEREAERITGYLDAWLKANP
jgi:HPt (histidine-containing phosphotransfer) domain-containing protein